MTTGALAAVPDCHVSTVPVSDGGDGLTEVMQVGLGGQRLETTVAGPRRKPVRAPFCLIAARRLAVVEMATASGLALLAKAQYDPMRTTTYGTGELIRAAIDHGARRIIVGIGGSATCEGGIGMAAALGFRFLDRDGVAVDPVGESLSRIAAIDRDNVDPRLSGVSISVACDVVNPLTGSNGASQVYAPQKGATPAQVRQLDDGLANLARVIHHDLGIDIAHLAGAGAAGGLGGGLHAFLGGELKAGIDLVLDAVDFSERIRGTDLVMTAEGRIDAQTRFNKAPAGVARYAKAAGLPCVALCGSIGSGVECLHDIGIEAIFSICDGPLSLEMAMRDASALLSRCSTQVVRSFVAGRSRR